MTDDRIVKAWGLAIGVLSAAAQGHRLRNDIVVHHADVLATLARAMAQVCRGYVGPHMRLEWGR